MRSLIVGDNLKELFTVFRLSFYESERWVLYFYNLCCFASPAFPPVVD